MMRNKVFGIRIVRCTILTTLALLAVATAQAGPPAQQSESPAVPGAPPSTTHTVDSTGDEEDANPGDGVCETAAGNGVCTLRAAIQEANARTGADEIFFDDSITLIMPSKGLPVLIDTSGGTTIRGNPTWILQSFTKSAYGLLIGSNNNKIQGLIITNFDAGGMLMEGNNNIIGADGDGVSDDAEGNLISSNGGHGAHLRQSATGNWLTGNRIGLNLGGTDDAGNGGHGIMIEGGAHSNRIGTNGDGVSDELERNVISGNDESGIYITGDGTDQNVIAGNYIGVNAAGNAALPNGDDGVEIEKCADNLVGTDGDGVADDLEGNLISGNGGYGVNLNTDSSGSVIAGNYIGTNAAGDAALPNDYVGIVIHNASHSNLIGTNGDGVSDELEGNLVSGSKLHGIALAGSGVDGNTIAGNYIGTNADGDAALPNTWTGVFIWRDSANNLVGTDGDGISDALEGNLISGNGLNGVHLDDSTTGNVVAGNYIGTDASGSGNLGNGKYGVNVAGGSINNTIGGTTSGTVNRIAFNDKAGIRVNESCYDNSLRGNVIFSNGELGIDLWPDEGVTLNDPGDGDDGTNHLQNYPVLSSATSNGNQIVISSSLNSSSSTTFALDFYANSSCDPSGYGEGEIYLGAEIVTTDASGDASFTTTLADSVPADYYATATATDPNGNTSEFSLCQLVTVCDPVEIVTTTMVISGCVVDFAAELTGDPPFTYIWDFDAFGSRDAPTPTVDFGGDGTYPFVLTALNCGGAYSDTYAGKVTVACGVCTPVTSTRFTWEPLKPTVGAEITFEGMAQGSTPITFTWDLSNTVTGATVKHTYTVTGAHAVTLTTENDCGMDEAMRTVVIGEAATKDYFIYLPILLRE